MDKKVAILVSTYNGEKYIKEQIDSILEQTYSNIEIIVRDDGSTDGTIKILKEYEKNGRLKLYLGKNKGFIQSFFELLRIKSDANYYAFADQDDIWDKNKIERAVSLLEKEDLKSYLLYCSNYIICDENGNKIAKHKTPKNISFANSLVECIAPGMTMVINENLRRLILSKKYEECYYHDWWIYLVGSAVGKVIYDDYESVKYRRHAKVQTKREQNWIKIQLWRIKQATNKNYFNKTKKQIQLFYNEYKDILSKENLEIITPFATKWSIRNMLKKVTYPKKYRNGIFDELVIRLFLLVNII